MALLLLLALAQDETSITKERLEKIVTVLAADDMKGRKVGTPEGKKAAEWMAAEFQKLGLKKGAGTGYLQEFDYEKTKAFNVLGLVPGETDEIVVLGCHHDHIGERNGQVCNGADDNASGCSVVLETARIAAGAKKPRRTILFCSFDAEEEGLIGSAHFVNSKLYDTSKFAGMVCLDLVGGNFFATETTNLYALGTEHSPEMNRLLTNQPKIDNLDVEALGVYLIEPFGPKIARSDYANFRRKNVPFVFFSTGTPWYYHRPEDKVERLNLDKLERAARFICHLTLDLANAEKRPTFDPNPPNRVEDAKILQAKLRTLINKDADLKKEDVAKLKRHLEKIDKMVEAGTITSDDKNNLQGVMIDLLKIAVRKPK